MTTTFTICPMYKTDNQWRIYYANGDYERSFCNLRELEVVSLYHCVAKALGLEYSQSEIDRTTNAITCTGHYKNVKWTIHSTWGDNQVELMHYTNSGCPSTYGAINKDILTDLIKQLGEWLNNNDIHQLSYENLKNGWLKDVKLGIGHLIYPMYQHLYDADEDFSPKKLAEYKSERSKRDWERASEMALTIYDTDVDKLKVDINGKYTMFHIYTNGEYKSLKYPPLKELKEDKLFLKMLKKVIEYNGMVSWEFVMFNWVESKCDFPTFPINYIYATDYPNFTETIY